jgi:sugar phosphate isomerase/epimerase
MLRRCSVESGFMKISIVADELSADPETAFELGLEWGVDRFELRGVHDGRVPRIPAHVRRRLERAISALGVTIEAVSPGLFKIPFPPDDRHHSNLGWMDREFDFAWQETRALLDDHVENLLPQSLEFADSVGACRLIAFSFSRGGASNGKAPQGVVEVLEAAAELAAASGIELLIENEEGHWASTGCWSDDLLSRIGSSSMGLNWDPANARIDGDTPFPDGYALVKHRIRNVHFKDVVCFEDGTWNIAQRGEVDWQGQISALLADGYDGAIAVEPHLSPPVRSTRDALEYLRNLISFARTPA